MKLLLHRPFFFFLFLFFALLYSEEEAAATPITANANDGVVTMQPQPFGRPVEGAPIEGEEKHRPEGLKSADEERQPLSAKKAAYFFRVTKDSSQSKKKVLVAFIPSEKKSLMDFIEEIIREIFKALPYPLSSKVFSSSNPNDVNTRNAPVPSSDKGRVHEIFNMMGCKKEIAVKDTYSGSLVESCMVCKLDRLFLTFCMAAVLCLCWLLHWQWMLRLLFVLACYLAFYWFIQKIDLPPPAVLFFTINSVVLLIAWDVAAKSKSTPSMDYHRKKSKFTPRMDCHTEKPKFMDYRMRTNTAVEIATSTLEPLSFSDEQDEDPKEEKASKSSNMASLRTNSHQRLHTHELAKIQENIPASINLVTSESARTSTHQDNEVSSKQVQNHPDEMLTGHQRPFYQFGIYTFTPQRNCLRFFWFFVLIITFMIIITICYKPRRNFIISTPKLELTASKETQEFILHRSGSRVLLPTKNDMKIEGKEKELGTSRSTKHVGSLRESTMINSSSKTDVKLRIVVPIKTGFHDFIKISSDPENKHALVTGFVVDVFNEAMKTLLNQVSWEFIPYEASYKDATGYYDKLAHQINLKSQEQSYDAVVGDVTMTAKRSKYGDFSLPFLSSGISMIVPIEDDNDVNRIWWFFKPLSAEMWIVTFVFFLLKGVLLFLLEHKTNQDFQLGTIMSFAIATSAQRGNLESGSSKFIVDLWTVSLFIIGAAYSANLSMLLSNGTPQVTNTDLETLIKNGDNVGYPNGSFVFELLKQWGFHESKLKAYSTEKEYVKALSLGSAKNGVSAIVDEIPYIRVFLTRYGHRYAMGGLNRMITGSFGFLFPKGSKIVHDISGAILQLQEVGRITEIREKWFEPLSCSSGAIEAPGSFKKLGIHQFRGLFLITGLATCAALLLPLLIWCYQHKKDVIIPQWEKIKAGFCNILASLSSIVFPT